MRLLIIWHRRRESNPPHSDRQSDITIRWSLRYNLASAVGFEPTIYDRFKTCCLKPLDDAPIKLFQNAFTLLWIRTTPRRPKRCVLPLHQITTNKHTCLALLVMQTCRFTQFSCNLFYCSCLEHILKHSYFKTLAVGVGFEPTGQLSPTGNLANCYLKPLRQPTINFFTTIWRKIKESNPQQLFTVGD